MCQPLFLFVQVDLDKTKEQLLTTTQQLEEKEKALLAAELEVSQGHLHHTSAKF